MLRIGKLFTYCGSDVNLKNLKCKVESINDLKIEVTFDDRILGRFSVSIDKKDII